MQIQFLYFEDCPSHEDGLARLKVVMAEEGISSPIEIIQITTDKQAQAYDFIGSPTILVDGRDIVAPPPEAMPALTCRVYQWEDGRFSPLPSPQMIRISLQNAQQKEKQAWQT